MKEKIFVGIGIVFLGWIISTSLYFTVEGIAGFFHALVSWSDTLSKTSVGFIHLPIWAKLPVIVTAGYAIYYGKKHGWIKIIGDKVYLWMRFLLQDTK